MKVKIGPYPRRLTTNGWPESLEWLENRVQDIYNIFNRLYFDRKKQVREIRIDPWDTWSMDHTLAYIIVPMLKQLKDTKAGAPYVSLEDVPEELKVVPITEDNVDDKHFERWDWVLNEMIWAFEQKNIDWQEQYYGPWIEDKDCSLGGYFEHVDYEGMNAHHKRMTNGFRLFGKYYEGLWD